MKKTFYFQHDYNARSDPKLQDVLIEHGVEGIGVYWCIVEMLYEQDGMLELRSCKSIAFALHTQLQLVESVVKDYDLFKNDGEVFWSESIKRRLMTSRNIAAKRKMAALSRWQITQAETDASASKNDANAMQMHQKSMQMQCKCMVKESKEKKSKENNNISTNVDTSTCVDAPEQKKEFSVDYSRLLALWKEQCPSFPQPRSLADDDKRKIRKRFGEMMIEKEPETAYRRIKAIFQTVNASDFCKKGKWCTFRWIFTNATNWRKVEDGNYTECPHGNNNKRANDEWK